MVYQSSTNLYQNSKYIVSAVAGDSPFTTIQAAINAANAAGGNATVYIRTGSYTENLTLYSTVHLEGVESTTVTITGIHTPPNAGTVNITRIGFVSGTDVLNSAAAGAATIKFTRCSFSITNGYICNLANWTGAILFKYCNEGTSTTDGVISNTGGSQVDIINSTLGYGTGKALTTNGTLTLFNVKLGCPLTLAGSAVSLIDGGSDLLGAVTVSATADLTVNNSYISTGAATALTTTSTIPIKLSNVGINTSNAVAIAGTGTVNFNSVTFADSKALAGTIVEGLVGVLKTGENYSNTILRMDMSGFYSWAAAAPYFDDTTLGTFKLLVGGTGYIKGKVITWVAQNITGLTAGNTYWIYIDPTGTIGKASARTDALFVDNIVLFECMRDSTAVTNNQVTVKENHPYNFQTEVSNYDHDVIGTVIENANNGANITLVGTQGIGISGADVYSDHGLDTDIPDSGGVGVTWIRMFTLVSGKWARQNATTTFTGFWNNGGTATALTAGRWGVYRLYVCKDTLNATTPTYFAVLDTAQYTNLGNAQTAIANDTPAKATNELMSLELCQLGTIIYRESTATIVQVNIAKQTLRSTTSSGGTSIASLVTTNVTNFNNVLSAADTNVQSALDTIDDFGSGTGIQTVNLYTGAGVKTVTLGSTNTTSVTTLQAGSVGMTITTATGNGPIDIVSGTGTIGIATSATNSTVNIGTGAGIKAVTLGSGTTTSSTAINCGTAGLTVGTTANAHSTTVGSTSGASLFTLQGGSGASTITTANGTLTVATGTGQIDIGCNTAATTVHIGYEPTIAAYAKTIVIGSNSHPNDATSITSGTGGMHLTNYSGEVEIFSAGIPGLINIDAVANNTTTQIATGAGIKLLTLGSTNTTSSTTIQSGSAGISITSATANGPITIVSGTGTIGIATSATASTVNVGTGAGVKTCSFGSTNTTSITTVACGTGGCNLGTTANAHITTVGSTTTTASTVIQSGTVGIGINATNGPISIASGTGQIDIGASATNSTINLGTGAGVKVVTLGSTTTTSSLALKYGTGNFLLASASGNVMTATSAGLINYPLQSAFLAVLATTVTNKTGDGTNYSIVFDTEVFDQNSNFDGVSTFTAPVTGRYRFSMGLTFIGLTNAYLDAFIRFITTNRSYLGNRINPAASFVSGGYLGLTFSVLTDMTAGDTAVMAANASNSTKVIGVYGVDSTNVYTYFSGGLED
jgi:hypothetical protein